MAAVFLVTLYEYSPLFYITVVFVCFLVTSGLVLAWSGLGVPVILRNLEETESSARMLKRQMRQVKNPFGLEILHPATASVTMETEFKYLFGSEFEIVPNIREMAHIGSEIHVLLHHWGVVNKADLHWHLLPSQMWSLPMVEKRAAAVLPLCLHQKSPTNPKQEIQQRSLRGIILTPDCLEDCILTCYWGCSVQNLHKALQNHVYCFRIKTPQALEDALYSKYLYRQQYFIKKNDKEEKHCQLPEDAQVVDFGPVPRSWYPLVALLTLADEEDREIYDIISMVSVIHIPDESYRLPCRILYQYVLLAQGQYHELKQLYMSANSTAASSSDTSPGERSTDRSLLERAGLAEDEPELHEENSRDCVVCQNGTVNWVLLPCRHTCLCDGCIKYFQQCPMCRQFVQESFPLCSETEQDEDE